MTLEHSEEQRLVLIKSIFSPNLTSVQLVNPGHAEVTFVNRGDAVKAVEIYHNRQLDGKPMKCQLVGSNK